MQDRVRSFPNPRWKRQRRRAIGKRSLARNGPVIAENPAAAAADADWGAEPGEEPLEASPQDDGLPEKPRTGTALFPPVRATAPLATVAWRSALRGWPGRSPAEGPPRGTIDYCDQSQIWGFLGSLGDIWATR